MTSVEKPSATSRPAALPGGLLSSGSGELPFASDLLAVLKPTLLVQLGVGSGETYFSLCRLLSQSGQPCTTYAIGVWPAIAWEKASALNKEHYQSFSHLLQLNFDQALAGFDNGVIGFLLINPVQPFEALRKSFDSWLAKLDSNGVVLFNGLADRDLSRLWKEISETYPSFTVGGGKGWGLLMKSAQVFQQLEFLGRFDVNQDKRSLSSVFKVVRWHKDAYETTPDLSRTLAVNTWVNLQIKLPLGTGQRALRLDVSDKAAVVDIATLSLRKEDGHTLWTWNPKEPLEQIQAGGTATRMPEPEFFRVLALGASPQVFLPELVGNAFDQPLELDIRLRVDLELAALKDLAKKLPEDGSLSTAALESAITKAKVDSARYLAQSRIEYDAKIRQLTAEADLRIESLRAELEALRAEIETTRVSQQHSFSQQSVLLAEERRSHQVTKLERENLQSAHPRLLQEISIAQGNVEELKAEVERLSGELATAEYDLAEVRKINVRLSATLEEERRSREGMQESGSWQLTKPLRAVGDLFGPRKKY